MSLAINVKNTQFPVGPNVELTVTESGKDKPENVTLGPGADRTFFVVDEGALSIVSGKEYVAVTYPHGKPAPAKSEPVAEPPVVAPEAPAVTEPEPPKD